MSSFLPRRPLAFSLRTLLVLVTAICTWLAWEHWRQNRIALRFCTDEEWQRVSRDFSFWEEDIGDEDSPKYERWVDQSERLDAHLAAALGNNTYNSGDISNFRCRGVYVPAAEFSWATVKAVHTLLTGEFADWEVFVHVGLGKEGDPSLGSVLVHRNEATATRGLEAFLLGDGGSERRPQPAAP